MIRRLGRFARAFLALLCAAALPLESFAAAFPLRIAFQGRLTDNRKIPKNGLVNMTLKLYAQSSGGSPLYTEGPMAVNISSGFFSLQVGEQASLSPDLFSQGSLFLGVSVQGDAEMTPRRELVSGPYSMSSAQLVQTGDIRVNAGANYSTFTAAGGLAVPFGVSAGTGSFSGSLTASSGSFMAAGNTQYGMRTSSGILVEAGTVKVAQWIEAGNFFGDGSGLSGVGVAPGSVDTNKLAADAVAAVKLITGAVSAGKLGSGAVETAKLAADAVAASAIFSQAVSAAKLAPNSVETAKLVVDSVIAAAILGGAVQTAKIGTDSVSSAKLISQSVTAGKLATAAVETAKLAADAVGASAILGQAVTAAKLAPGSVETAKFAVDAVATASILGQGVTAPKLASGAADTSKHKPSSRPPRRHRRARGRGTHPRVDR